MRGLHRVTDRGDGDEGAYAVLYSVLVVVLLTMGAIVVDLASVRQDRRLNRSAADSAAAGGALFLNPQALTGMQPYEACRRAWDYVATTLRVSIPAGACSSFSAVTNPASYCSAAAPAEIADERTIGSRTVRIAWPVPRTGGSGFLNPDIAPGSVSQNFTTSVDGTDAGCDRLGVAIFENEKFGLGGALGISGTTTQVHSVARLIPDGGTPTDVAALNVLNGDDCQTLRTTGGGRVLVGPTLDTAGNAVAPGIIAVESLATGPGSNCGGQDTAIDAGTGNSDVRQPNQPGICAALTSVLADTCDGLGRIESHALDPGGNAARAYNPASYPNKLLPRPTPEGVARAWTPVTSIYGCRALSNCLPPATNYIDNLVSAYAGTGLPTTKYSGSEPPYAASTAGDPYPGGFVNRPELCGAITTLVIVPAGNNYADCSIDIGNGGVVIVQGGTLVVDGRVTVASGGCLVINTAASTCPAAADIVGTGASVTTLIPPAHDAIVFVRGRSCGNPGCFQNAGTFVAPQTFVYSHGNEILDQRSSGLTLWTAPGAGAMNSNGHTQLEVDCGATAVTAPDQACLDSRFQRLTFWSEYAAPFTKGNFFGGQGNLNVVGVFFTPRAFFNLTGGGTFKAAAAQFWADILDVNGGARLALSPYQKFGIPQDAPLVTLIR